MSVGLNSFLGGLAGGVSMGMQAKKLGQAKDTSQVQAPSGTQAVQATAQNQADKSAGVGLPQMTPQQGTQTPTAAGGSLWGSLMQIIGQNGGN